MNLLDILSSYKQVRNDIVAGSFLKAWEDTIPLQQGLIDLGKSIGFKATAEDAATRADITSVAESCVALCEADKGKTAALGSFDWKSFVAALVQALLAAWKQNNP